MNQEVVNNLKRYKSKSLLKHAAMNVLVKHLNPKDIESLRANFEALDTDGSGYLEYSKLQQALDKSKFDIDLKIIIKELDYAKDSKISYSEFIAASIHVSKYNF